MYIIKPFCMTEAKLSNNIMYINLLSIRPPGRFQSLPTVAEPPNQTAL